MARKTEEERMNQAREVVQQQRESGQNVTTWCKEHGVAKSKFYRYVRIVERGDEVEAGTTSDVINRHEPGTGGSCEPEVGCDGTMVVVHSGAVTVQIGLNASTSVIESVIRALKATC